MTKMWNTCPKCGSAVASGFWNHDIDNAWRTKTCMDCGFAWNEVMEFCANENLDGEELDEEGNVK